MKSPLLVFGLFAFMSANAVAQTVESLDSVVASGICPANLTTYNWLGYEPCDPIKNLWKVQECQHEIERQNHSIYRYNDFVRKCRDAARKSRSSVEGSSGGNVSKWQERERKAAERSASRSKDPDTGDKAYSKVTKKWLKRSDEQSEREARKRARMERQEALQAEKEKRAIAKMQRQLERNREKIRRQIVNQPSIIGSNPVTGRSGRVYPPNCRNKRAYDSCAVYAHGCQLYPGDDPSVCIPICSDLCNE